MDHDCALDTPLVSNVTHPAAKRAVMTAFKQQQIAHALEPRTKKRVLGVVAFAFIATQLVAGGPWGLEVSVKEAGPGPVFLCFALFPLLFSVPQALITAELSTLLDSNGGYVVWTTHAFGPFWGYIVGMNGLLGNIIDLSLYPMLVSEYLTAGIGTRVEAAHLHPGAEVLPVPRWLQCLIFMTVVTIGLLVNVRGIGDVARVSSVAFVAMMAPFAVSLVWQLPQVLRGLTAVLQVAPSIDYGAFLSTVIWGYTGWNSLGALAGEVRDPARTYPRGTAITLVLVTLCYALPCLVSITTHPRYREWTNGSLTSFTGDVGGWLATLALLASVACQVSVFTAGLSTSARTMWALAGGTQSSPESTPPAGDAPAAGGSPGAQAALTTQHLPSFLALEWPATGAPIASLALHCGLIGLMFAFPFQWLVQADILLACVPLVFMVAAFVKLRITQPVEARQGRDVYNVPFGWKGVAALVLPKTAVLLVALLAARRGTWVVPFVVNAVAAAVYGLRMHLQQRTNQASPAPSKHGRGEQDAAHPARVVYSERLAGAVSSREEGGLVGSGADDDEEDENARADAWAGDAQHEQLATSSLLNRGSGGWR
jgi:amino acid transporter